MPGVWTRREIARRTVGVVGEVGLKAYGAAAVLSVALSEAETVRGKSKDAITAVPNLVERYRDAQYVVEHRQEIQASVDYIQQHAPDSEELEATAEKSAVTLEQIAATYEKSAEAWDSITTWRVWRGIPDAWDHLNAAWDSKPGFGSIEELAAVAEDVAPFVEHGEVLIPRVYGLLLLAMDNFSSDEIMATIGVMGVALAVAYALGAWLGFWARRGRPRLIARTLQRWGARRFASWYVANPRLALGKPVAAVARERVIQDIVADPGNTLDEESLSKLKSYFEARMSRVS